MDVRGESTVDWKFLDCDPEQRDLLSQKLGISKVVSTILQQRGLNRITDAERFISPKMSDFSDPFLLKNMHQAVELLDFHVGQNSPIAIIGDYDVDGITSIVLLIDILQKFGANPQYFVPKRFTEGYGMSKEIVGRMMKKLTPRLVIALDCGTNSLQEIEMLRKKDIDVLVIDHHILTRGPIPDAIIINPHLFDSNPSLQAMCAVALTFKFAHAFLKYRRTRGDELAFTVRLKSYFDIIALGIIADMVPVRYENRIIAKYGLQSFAKVRRPGLDALCTISNIPPGVPLNHADVSFKLAPRINVSGRLSDAILPIELLRSNNLSDAMVQAKQIDRMNRERQRLEHIVVDEAKKIIAAHYRHDPGIVLFNPKWHSGVVGIAAGKISRTYNRSTIILALERGLAKGSGRSVGDHLVEVLAECASYVDVWGGHKMAIGISLKPENVDAFRIAFNRAIEHHHRSTQAAPEAIEIAHTLNVNDISDAFVQELERCLHPYGQENDEPIFCIRNVRFPNCMEVFGPEKRHFRFWVARHNMPWLTGIAWEMASRIPEQNRSVDILVTIGYDTWNNENFILLKLVDWKYST
ncbi:MAG: single-stranded-DNA-specific exonuclease RecJ [Puniceicoccales bacterium]|jgi:single-stranded-DNA-specific exonuclease|nr:single-stranded-DNA-specific exonuclease RecJ [Puniceicoccales bacterium]